MYLRWCIRVGFSRFTFLWHRGWVRVPYEEQVRMRFTWSWAFFLHSIVISGVLFFTLLGIDIFASIFL